jgi:hypothetical protein
MPEADIWTVFGGTNDWYYGSALGSVAPKGSDFDKTTIYGALQAICEHILAEENNPRLVLVSPSFANRERAGGAQHKPTYEQIRTAFAEVAALYGVEHLDMWKAAGINESNAAEMLKDGVHPTTAGATLLANAISAQLGLVDVNSSLDSTDAVVIKGIELSFDDYYTFDAEKVELVSKNDCITLSGNTIHAEKLTEAPVLLKVDGILHMISVKPAKVALFLVDGQSNARGVAGDLDETRPIAPDKGNGYIYEGGALKDMKVYMDDKFASITNNNSIGFAPALAAEWYELTGEKAVIIQQGHDGAPIHFWSEKGYTTSTSNLIKNAITAIKTPIPNTVFNFIGT